MSQNAFIPFNPNLQDVDRGHDVVAIVALFTVLIVLATGIRIGVKLTDRIKIDIDDYLSVLGLAFNLTCNIIELKAVEAGFGRHLQYLSNNQAQIVIMLNELAILFATLALWATKTSISFFILRLIQGTHRYLRWATYALIALTSTTASTTVVLWATQASPLQKLWNPEVPGTLASPQKLVVSIYFSSCVLAVTDFFYALAPIYFLAKVQMSFRKKAIVMCLTGSGLLVFACSVVRLCFEEEFFDLDSSWALVNVYICTIVERNLANVITDLPAIYTLARNWHKRILTLTSRDRTATSKFGTAEPSLHDHLASRSNAKYNKFGIDRNKKQLSSFEQAHGDGSSSEGLWCEYSHNDVPLREVLASPAVAASADGQSIVVQTDIDVESQKRPHAFVGDSEWPLGHLRPGVSS